MAVLSKSYGWVMVVKVELEARGALFLIKMLAE